MGHISRRVQWRAQAAERRREQAGTYFVVPAADEKATKETQYGKPWAIITEDDPMYEALQSGIQSNAADQAQEDRHQRKKPDPIPQWMYWASAAILFGVTAYLGWGAV